MKISKEKREKISEQVLAYLFSINPKPAFTSHIAREVARDEEFIKNLLQYMKSKNFIVDVKKNPKGSDYLRRIRWKLTEATYTLYRNLQDTKNSF